MFRRLEGYANESGTGNIDVWSRFKTDQTSLATTTLVPSTYLPPDDINEIVRGATPSANIDIESSMSNYATSLRQLNADNATCIGAKTIEATIALNQSGPIQCGWYYNPDSGSKPVGQGYLSTKRGPVVGLTAPLPAQPSTFYFGNNAGTNRFVTTSSTTSLQAGQQRIDTDRCRGDGTCQSVVGKLGCAYCGPSKRGIPIDTRTGLAKYPSLTCASPLLTTCPAPEPSSTASISLAATANAAATTTRSGIIRRTSPPAVSACEPEDGRFSGACLQSILRDQGCGVRGSLSLALNGFTSTSDTNSIANNSKNIQEYKGMNPAFDLTSFLSASNKQDAETQAKALSDASKTAVTAALANPKTQTKKNTLAIDLCTQRGYFLDNYNFCIELDDKSQKPSKGWDLVCLQQAWKAAGLWAQGKSYPTVYTMPIYNRLMTWKNVKDYMNNIYKEIYDGAEVKEGFATGQVDYVSPPFLLQSHNFPTLYLTFKGTGPQLVIEAKNTANPSTQQFVWKKGSGEGTIRIVPVAATTNVLRYRNYSLHSDTYYRRDSVLNNESTFYVRPGMSDSNKISLESLNMPGFFLRHAGYRMWLHRSETGTVYKADATFLPQDIKGAPLQKSFFIPTALLSQVAYTADQRRYLGQKSSNRVGWGQELEPLRSNPSVSGIELFKCTPANGITVITDYSTTTTLSPPSTGVERMFTLTSLISPTTQDIIPSITLNKPNIFLYAVNSYLQNLRWPSNKLVDADSNQYPVMKQLKLYNSSTKNVYSSSTLSGAQSPFTLRGKVPNILSTCLVTGGNALPYNFTLPIPASQMFLVRDKYAPFLRFEVLQDSITNNTPLFTELRLTQMGDYIKRTGPIQYFNKSSDILKAPGTNGYMQLSSSQINLDYVDNNVWACATFAFSLASIPSTTSAKACPLLTVGNTINRSAANGYRCAVYGSSNNNIKFVVQTLSYSGTVTNSSITIPIAINSWYMASITDEALTLYKVDNQTTSVAGVIVWDPSITIRPFSSSANIGPLLQIGDVTSSASLNVAWLRLFDTTISSIDTTAELIGYAPGGYETGTF